MSSGSTAAVLMHLQPVKLRGLRRGGYRPIGKRAWQHQILHRSTQPRSEVTRTQLPAHSHSGGFRRLPAIGSLSRRSARYTVVRLTPSTSPICATVMSCCSYNRRAVRTWSADNRGGRPPVRPRARAAASPAWVRSRMRSRSNSANAANTWKTSRPPGEVVSIVSCSDRKTTPRSPNAWS